MRKSLPGALALALAGVATPSLAQSPDWSGFYLGVIGGQATIDNDDSETLLFDRNLDGSFNDTVTTTTAANAFGPGFCGGRPITNAAAGGCNDDDDRDSDLGARLGYDWQMGSFVFGAVAEVSFPDAEDSVTGFSTTPASYTFTRSVEAVTALRARMGFVFGPALAYVTGGVARATVENAFTTSNTANTFTPSGDDEADGYQLGGGVEYALTPRLSITGEYLRTSVEADPYVVRVGQGTAPATNPFVLAPNTTGTDIIRSSDEIELNSFRVGLSYRF